jgi:FKBP-type peptidyl-prolyl cis-trans isomerase
MRSALLIVLLVACQRDDNKVQVLKTDVAPVGSGSSGFTLPKVEQVKPPIPIDKFPKDAVKTSSGLIYKKLVENPTATAPLRNDTVLINYTGWRHKTGETFFSNKQQNQPMPLNLATTAVGFTEAMQLVRKGETVMLWIPPDIGYKGPPQGEPEMLVYEVEVVDIVAAPLVPPNYNAPPADAKELAAGAKLVVVKAGDGKEMARNIDTVTFDYTAWDNTGRMFDSTEMRKRPAAVPPYRQSAVMEEVLTTIAKGDRVRFWVDSQKMAVGGKASGLPDGLLCYELEMQAIERAKGTPPPVPHDVKAPPADAKKTAKGLAYKVLKKGKRGAKPGPTDNVRVNYTGWTTDGRMFDSSALKAEPSEFALNGVMTGWTEGMQLMSVGDRMRFWIPEELAYKGTPGRPQGMLVFDIELLSFKPGEPVEDDHHSPSAGSGSGSSSGNAGPPNPTTPSRPAPPDVAAPPQDARKTVTGVYYKILKTKRGAEHPAENQKVRLAFTGWTTDGKQFDSSDSSEFSLARVIEGWKIGIPLIGVGEKARFWIPEALAYQGRGGGFPAGMLVFDVELLGIVPE